MSKCDDLISQVTDFKLQHGYYPKELELDASWIPDECVENMVLEIEQVKIPIVPIGGGQ